MKVSIITAFYRGNSYINNLLKSIIQNSSECKNYNIEIEYIIVNDSPDVEVLINAELDYDFKLIIETNVINSGIHQSRVNGLKKATGEYVLFIDQDDVLLPHAILEFVRNSKKMDVIIGNGYIVNENGKSLIYKSKTAQNFAVKKIFYEYCTSMCVSPGHVFLKKDSIPNEWCEYILKTNGSDDYFLWLLMLDKKLKFGVVFDATYEHICTNNNLSLDRKKMYQSSEKFCEILTDNKLIDKNTVKRINRRTNMKIQWNFKSNFFDKLILSIKNIDIVIINFVYKIYF